jgi:integrase
MADARVFGFGRKRLILFVRSLVCILAGLFQEQRWFMPFEVSQLVSNADGQHKAVFHLAASTGMRAGELFALRIDDIDFNRRVVYVGRSSWMGR